MYVRRVGCEVRGYEEARGTRGPSACGCVAFFRFGIASVARETIRSVTCQIRRRGEDKPTEDLGRGRSLDGTLVNSIAGPGIFLFRALARLHPLFPVSSRAASLVVELVSIGVVQARRRLPSARPGCRANGPGPRLLAAARQMAAPEPCPIQVHPTTSRPGLTV